MRKHHIECNSYRDETYYGSEIEILRFMAPFDYPDNYDIHNEVLNILQIRYTFIHPDKNWHDFNPEGLVQHGTMLRGKFMPIDNENLYNQDSDNAFYVNTVQNDEFGRFVINFDFRSGSDLMINGTHVEDYRSEVSQKGLILKPRDYVFVGDWSYWVDRSLTTFPMPNEETTNNENVKLYVEILYEVVDISTGKVLRLLNDYQRHNQ